MVQLLKNLHPRQELAEKILINELDDFSEVIFFNVGKVDVGFEINKIKKFVIRKFKQIIIADHGCTFNHKSKFIYKAKTICEGYAIKKLEWCNLLDS